MEIKVCIWKACSWKFSNYIIKRIENDKEKFDLENIKIQTTSCMWKCENWPNICIDSENYWKQNPFKTSELLNKKLKNENK